MAFPTAVNDQIIDGVISAVMSSAGLEKDSARNVVETVINHLASKEVLLKEDSSTRKEE